ncbi:alpha-amylase, partial [bacterium CG17_big_fil_post_rev_8_21_14_2_50_64_8]
MADPTRSAPKYFVFDFPLADQAWLRYGIASLVPGKEQDGAAAYAIRKLAAAVNDDAGRKTAGRPPTHAETLLALRTLNQVLKWVALRYFRIENPGGLSRCRQWATQRLGPDAVDAVMTTFVDLFPPLEVKRADLTGEQFLAGALDDLNGRDLAALEMFLLFLNVNNPAAAEAEHLFHDGELRRRVSYLPFVTGLEKYLTEFEVVGTEGVSLPHLLRAPLLASPDSLAGQLAWIRDHWAHLLPDELRERLQFALDVLQEVDVARGGEPGPAPVLEFGPGPARDEPEAFSRDADWMANVVLMAKSVSVWLDQLSKWYGRPLRTLADIPDEELDRLAHWGINGLWLIGLWERSAASRTIKQWLGNPDAAASAYSLADYAIASDL